MTNEDLEKEFLALVKPITEAREAVEKLAKAFQGLTEVFTTQATGQIRDSSFGLTSEALAKMVQASMDAQKLTFGPNADSIGQLQARTAALGAAGATKGTEGNNKQQADAAKAQADSVKKTWDKAWDGVDQAAHKAFSSILEKGQASFKGVADALRTGVRDLLYELTLKRWIIPISASLASVFEIGQSTEGENGNGAAGGGLKNAVKEATSLYKAVTETFSQVTSKAGTLVTSVGDMLGAQSISQFGLGLSSGSATVAARMSGVPINSASSAGAAAAPYLAAGAGLVGGHYLGNAISGGYGSQSTVNTGQAIGTALGAIGQSVGMIAGPFGAALGAVVGGVVGGIANRAFGMGDKKVTSQGIRGTLTASTLDATNYSNWHQDGGWFRSDKSGTDTQAVTAGTVKQFTQSLQAIETTSAGFAASLGVSAGWIKSYSKTFDITLTGTAAKDQQAITNFFNGVSDEIAKKLVPNLSTFTKSGETAAATLERLAGDFKGTDQVAQLLGVSASSMFGASGVASAKARERLIDLAGGLSTLSQEATTFNKNFLTDAERIAPVAATLDTALGSLGLQSIPKTRDEFKALVDNLVASGAAATDSGAKQLSSLLALADAFSEVHPETATKALQERQNLQGQLDQLTLTSAQLHEKERASIDASNLALYDRVSALQAEKAASQTLLSDVDNAYAVLQKVVDREKAAVQASIEAHSEAVDKLKSLSQSLHGTLDSLKAPEQKLSDRTLAQAQIRDVLASVKAGGKLPEADELANALSAVTQDASGQFSSYNDYLRDLYRTQSDIAQLGGITDTALTVEQQALENAKEQLKTLDAVLTNAQAQIDELKGQSITLLSIDQAVRALSGTIAVARTNPVVAAGETINKTYQTALGRAPDAAGKAYWEQAALNGVSAADIQKAIETSPEAQVRGLYQTLLNRPADDAGLNYWLNSGASVDAIKAALMQSGEYTTHHVPGFAAGGDFAGGWRVVGESGPELEVTGPARIFSANQTTGLLRKLTNPSSNNDALIGEVKALRAEIQAFREANSAENAAIAKHTLNTADHLDAAINGDTPLATKPIKDNT